jgi:S-adenosyl-L-methionine hydrolase (adenosine-forming)
MLITLLTDFGDKDPYVGIMKGVIYGLNPAARLVDLTHQVTPQAVREGAFLLHTAYPYFPAGTVHLAVVDPGVGTNRKAICIRVPAVGYFVGPDNGLFSYILDNFPEAAVREITNPAFQRAEVSATFHGRDIFAPTAALLALGQPWEEVGPLLAEGAVVRLVGLWPQWTKTPEGRSITGEIIHVDHFGTLVTNLPQQAFETVPAQTLQNARLHSAGLYKLQGVRRTYGEGVKGEIIALFGSSGYLEIARVNGQAANLRGPNEPHHAWLGQKVTLKLEQ